MGEASSHKAAAGRIRGVAKQIQHIATTKSAKTQWSQLFPIVKLFTCSPEEYEDWGKVSGDWADVTVKLWPNNDEVVMLAQKLRSDGLSVASVSEQRRNTAVAAMMLSAYVLICALHTEFKSNAVSAEDELASLVGRMREILGHMKRGTEANNTLLTVWGDVMLATKKFAKGCHKQPSLPSDINELATSWTEAVLALELGDDIAHMCKKLSKAGDNPALLAKGDSQAELDINHQAVFKLCKSARTLVEAVFGVFQRELGEEVRAPSAAVEAHVDAPPSPRGESAVQPAPMERSSGRASPRSEGDAPVVGMTRSSSQRSSKQRVAPAHLHHSDSQTVAATPRHNGELHHKLNHLRDAFNVIDDGSHFMSTEKLRHNLLTTGLCLSAKEVKDMLKNVKTTEEGNVSLDSLFFCMTGHRRHRHHHHEEGSSVSPRYYQ